MITRNNYELFIVEYLDGHLNEQQEAELRAFLLKNPDIKAEFKNISTAILKPQTEEFDNSFLKKHIGDLEFTKDNADELIISLIENDYPKEKESELLDWINSSDDLKDNFYLFNKLHLSDTDTSIGEKSFLYKLPDFENDKISHENAQMFAVAKAEGDLSVSKSDELNGWISESKTAEIKEFDFEKLKIKPDYNIIFDSKSRLYKKSATIRRIALYSTSIAAGLALLFGVWNNNTNRDENALTNQPIATTEQEEKKAVVDTVKIEENIKVYVAETKSQEPQRKTNRHIVNRIEKIEKLSGIEVDLAKNLSITSDEINMQLSVYETELAYAYEPEIQDDITESENVYEESKRFSLKNLVQRGIDKIVRNSRQLDVERSYDEESDSYYFAFQTPNFVFEKISR
ncbi:MAG TPA: hypothetical protein PLY32_01900 [Salinivirgaceae bacterium]|nr:hypothetical protein [Salinivirgaceae bacterium]HQA75852.1 hypothetical protein [Salinivirgaceae bacterium]